MKQFFNGNECVVPAFRLKAKQKPSAPLTQSDLASSLHFPMGEPADLIRCLVMQGLAPLYQRAIAASPTGEAPRFEWLSGVWMGGQRGYMLLIEGKAVAWLSFEAAGSLAPGAPEPLPESTVPVRRAVLGIQFIEWPQAPIGIHHTPPKESISPNAGEAGDQTCPKQG